MTRQQYNCQKLNLKRKRFAKGKGQRFKRFKKTPKYVRDNPENQIAREKAKTDVYDFQDDDFDNHDDLGMGLEISDLPFLTEDNDANIKELIAFTQDSVTPLFNENSTDIDSKLEDALAELRYTSFRPHQKEAIKRVLSGKSTLFISPTGSGKSLCYQLPALLYSRYKKYMTIVVSPLISLMEDQMANFPKCLRAVSLHSGHNRTHRQKSMFALMNGEAQVAFISPEAIVNGILELEDLKSLPPVGFVCIDEAHCLSEWSHNFRPAYLQFLRILHDQMNIKTYLGLTATANRSTAVTIAINLRIDADNDIVGSTTIPDNLLLSISYEINKEAALIKLLQSPTFVIMPSIIVYCNRRDETERLAAKIRTFMQSFPIKVSANDEGSVTSSENKSVELSWHSEAYHAGLSTDTRKRIQRQFIKGEIRVVVATVAFGMGINKANIRAVIHYDMPSSFENYVQEIGRAGRDGKPAQCHMFLRADKTDIFYHQRNIYSSVTERKNLRKLINYVFQPCACRKWLRFRSEDQEKLDQLNQNSEPHILHGFDRSVTGASDEKDSQADKENQTKQDGRVSKVKKYRACEGHEVAFSVDEATSEINLHAETIMTLICQLEQAYPQLGIRQLTPIKSDCTLLCHKGPTQMESLAKKCTVVGEALKRERLERLKTEGDAKVPTPEKITFNIVRVAAGMGKSSAEVARMCKSTEWELVEKTGKFRRSQVRVTLDNNSFHLSAVGDLDETEIDELHDYLHDYCKYYETKERDKVAKVYDTFRKHCISMNQIMDNDARLDISFRLRQTLNHYFDSSCPLPDSDTNLEDTHVETCLSSVVQEDTPKEKAARKTARAFLSSHRSKWTPITIARIFQGVSTPNYPAEHWGLNKKWWRTHLDLDFLRLTEIIGEEQLGA